MKTCLEDLVFTENETNVQTICRVAEDLLNLQMRIIFVNLSLSLMRNRINETNANRMPYAFRGARQLPPPASKQIRTQRLEYFLIWSSTPQFQSLRRLFRRSSRSASASARAACGSAFFPPATERLPPVLGRSETKNKNRSVLEGGGEDLKSRRAMTPRVSYSTARLTGWGRARPAPGTRWRRCTNRTNWSVSVWRILGGLTGLKRVNLTSPPRHLHPPSHRRWRRSSSPLSCPSARSVSQTPSWSSESGAVSAVRKGRSSGQTRESRSVAHSVSAIVTQTCLFMVAMALVTPFIACAILLLDFSVWIFRLTAWMLAFIMMNFFT